MVDLRGNRSGRTRSPRNYLGRREQLRILLMVGTLGLVIAMMSAAANPKNWVWLWGLDAESTTAAPAVAQPIDTRLRPVSDDSLPLDVFVAPAPKREEMKNNGDYFPEVDPALLKQVQDNTLLRRAEYDALFNLLDVLNRNDQTQFEAASLGEVGFAQLFKQPDTYRGRLVTLKGVIRRAFDMTPPANEFGLDRYYQLWLDPANGPRTPIVINALELPADFPTSRGPDDTIIELNEEVTVTGFFYRNWAYTTDVQVLTAPWVLAKQISWTPAPQAIETVAKPQVKPSQAWLAILGTAVLSIGFAIWVFVSSNSKAVPSAANLAKHYRLESVASLAEAADDYDPTDMLRQLAEQPDVAAEAAPEESSPTSHATTDDTASNGDDTNDEQFN